MAQIYLGRPVFYRRGESGMSAVVGIENHMARIARYEITAPSIGASSVSIRFVGWSDAGGTRPSYLRYYIGTDPSSHTDANANSPYTCRLSRSGSAFVGSADIVLLPSTRYYVWVFPDDFSTYGWMYWSIGAQDGKMETSGAAASVLSGSNGTLGSSHTLHLHRYSSAAVHKITATCGDASMTIVSGLKADSYSWTPPINWALQNTKGTTVSVSVICSTIINGQTVGTSEIRLTMTIPDSVVPSCRMTLSDPTGLLGELGTYVQGKSKVKIDATATGVYGSSIVEYEIIAGDVKAAQPGTEFELPDAGQIYVRAWARDSRGRWNHEGGYIDVAPYHVPKAEILKIYRCAADGQDNPQGDHATVVFDASVDPLVKATARYAIKYRVRGAQYWTTQQLYAWNGTQQIKGGTAIIPADPGLDYECSIEVCDRWPPARTSPYRTCPVAFALLQIDKERMAFGIGQQAGPDHTISVGLPIRCNADIAISGGLIASRNILAGEDVNQYTDPGLYSTVDDVTAARIVNLPIAQSGLLWVVNTFGTPIVNDGRWIYITQYYRAWRANVPTYRRQIVRNGAGVCEYGNWFSDAGAVSAAIMENV